jgi:hypothetical protein
MGEVAEKMEKYQEKREKRIVGGSWRKMWKWQEK